jgi:hypothetical protein
MNIKKIILAAAAAAALAGNSFAYNFYAGLHAGYISRASTDEQYSLLSPTLGFILNDKSNVSIGFEYISHNSVDSLKINAGYEYLILSAGKFGVYINPSAFYHITGTDVSDFGIRVSPNVQYGLTDRIVLFAGLNFFSLNFTQHKNGDSDFDFGANSGNVFESGNITAGLVYLF